MQAELVRTQTPDGLYLDGALVPPGSGSDSPSPSRALDALLCLHGAGSNFYGSTMRGLTSPLAADGVTLLWANTRGHDGISTSATDQGGVRQGAAFENVDECRHDVTGWVEFLLERGFERIGLWGHSLGAIKALYSQAKQPHAAIARVIAVSPPLLSFELFSKSIWAAPFREYIAQAQGLVNSGEGQTLMNVRYPLPLVISADSYLDKYGPSLNYDITRFAQQLTCPLLFVYGEIEIRGSNPAFAGIDETARQLRPTAGGTIDVAVVGGANHFYTGVHDDGARAVAAWSGWAE